MPIRKLCSRPACGQLAIPGQPHCPTHLLEDRQRRNQRVAKHGYGSKHWQQLRRQRLALAAHLCELRLPGCTRMATHVHLDKSLAGDHRRATLADTRACCPSCSGAIDAPRAHGGAGSDREPIDGSATRATVSRNSHSQRLFA